MIRQAVPADVKKAIPLIRQAIGDIAFVLSGTTDAGETELILSDFFRQPGNRLSYENCLVMEDGGEVVGIALLYDGAEAENLNLPVEQAAAKKTGNAEYQIPIEAEESEFYLDAIAINPSCHRRGFGTALIEAASTHASKLGHPRFALLVEPENSAAMLFSTFHLSPFTFHLPAPRSLGQPMLRDDNVFSYQAVGGLNCFDGYVRTALLQLLGDPRQVVRRSYRIMNSSQQQDRPAREIPHGNIIGDKHRPKKNGATQHIRSKQ
jgi:ribosomal protein S18 acetylase RimI-like enzyme